MRLNALRTDHYRPAIVNAIDKSFGMLTVSTALLCRVQGVEVKTLGCEPLSAFVLKSYFLS